MKAFGKLLGRVLLVLIVLIGGLWLFGPYEKAPLTPSAAFEIAGDADAYFAQVEGAFDDITPGTQKRVIWSGAPGVQTDWALVYVHGFSASSEEIRPVPDQVAAALGANVVYTRLQGHGRGPDAMAEGTVQGWVNDFAEAMAVARTVGQRTLVVSTSTGGTLVTAVAQNPQIMDGAAGVIFVSPNYGLNNPMAKLLSWPAARYWLPPLAGARRRFEPQNEAHGTYWTTEYDSVAVMPMVALIDAVAKMDHGRQTLPALFMFAQADQVVRPDITAQVAAAWGGDVTINQPVMGAGDDPQSHVIAGDIISPGQTTGAVQTMIAWVQGLES